MDSIDWEEQDNHFITMYVYLNAVDKNMSPLNIIKKSHIFGHTSFPHYIKDYPKKDYLEYSADNNDFKTFDKEMLIGETGSVYFWTSNTLHGTAPSNSEKEDFRISLRYLIIETVTAEPAISHFISSMPPLGLIEIPPLSKQTPLPTNKISTLLLF